MEPLVRGSFYLTGGSHDRSADRKAGDGRNQKKGYLTCIIFSQRRLNGK